jgi:dihydroxy-acid dehydratase
MKQLYSDLDLSVKTFEGKRLKAVLDRKINVDQTIIRSMSRPLHPVPTIAVLTGNLAPRGAILKASAADPKLLVHTGKALVFDDYHEMLARIDADSLTVDPSTVLVLKNAGARGVPGMPEWGMIPIPKKLKECGVEDMVRISDSRMSGTSFGTVILHVTPEAAAGGVFAIVQTGDMIRLDVHKRTLELLVDDHIIEERVARWAPGKPKHLRGYPLLYQKSILQADEGCDFDFLKPVKGERIGLVEPVVGRS